MNLGFPEMLFLFLLALLLFGPKKLPEIGRQIGRGLAEFKRASNELKGQLENEMRLLDAEDREKKTSPPPPENTIASVPATSSTPAESAPTSTSAAVGADHPATASDETPASHPGPGVEGA